VKWICGFCIYFTLLFNYWSLFEGVVINRLWLLLVFCVWSWYSHPGWRFWFLVCWFWFLPDQDFRFWFLFILFICMVCLLSVRFWIGVGFWGGYWYVFVLCCQFLTIWVCLLINCLFYDLFFLVLVHTGFNNRLTLFFFLLFGPVNFLLIDFSFW
jgi:hypothetical protein